MKKFKLIALTLLASTFGLTSCDAPAFLQKIPGINKLVPQKEQKEEVQDGVVSVKIDSNVSVVTDETEPFKLVAKVEVNGNVSKNVAWSSSDESVATVDENGLVTPLSQGTVVITATSKADSSKSDSLTIEVTTLPGVASVTIEGGQEEVILHTQSMQLSAVVATKGAAAKGVTWSSSDESVATVNASGLVYFVGKGSVTITATSVADSSKSDSITINVINHGEHPELVEEGWTFTEEWPYAEAKAFTGKYVDGFESKEGFYFLDSPAAGTSAAYFAILAEETTANIKAAINMLSDDSLFYFYNSSYDLDCFLDSTQTYEVDFFEYDIDDYSTALAFVYYYADDMFEGSTVNTTDTEWNDDVQDELDDMGVDLPFARLGEDYDPYVYSSGVLEISDYCKDFRKLMNYDLLLLADGFELDERDDGDVYLKSFNAYQNQAVEFYFNQYGNCVRTWLEYKEFDEWPTAVVNDFVDDFSKYTAPAFESAVAKYAYQPDEENDEYLIVDVINPTKAECEAYLNGLLDDFEDLLDAEDSEEFLYAELRKGKLDIKVEFDYLARESTLEECQAVLDALDAFESLSDEEFAALSDEQLELYDWLYDKYMEMYINYLFTGEIYFVVYDDSVITDAYVMISCDDRGMEEPGLYIYESKMEAPVETSLVLEPIFYQIDEADVVWSSSDEDLATVDENGKVTFLEPGEVEITVSIEGTEYSDTVVITITKSFAQYMVDINEVLAGKGATTTLELPKPEDFVYNDVSVYSSRVEFYFTTSETAAEYQARLVEAGWQLGGNGNRYAIKGEFKLDFYYFASYHEIDIYVIKSAWPTASVASYVTGLGSQDSVPAYSGSATDFTVSTGGQIKMFVGVGNEAAAIAKYQDDLLGAGYTLKGQDQYGDNHYRSEHDELDVCIWDGNTAGTPQPGYVYIDVQQAPVANFPLTTVNAYIAANDMGFTLGDDFAAALDAVCSSYTVSATSSKLTVSLEGDFHDLLIELLTPILTGENGAGYTLKNSTSYDYFANSNYNWVMVYKVSGGVTQLVFYP